jgi:hypothetical protein
MSPFEGGEHLQRFRHLLPLQSREKKFVFLLSSAVVLSHHHAGEAADGESGYASAICEVRNVCLRLITSIPGLIERAAIEG